MKRRNVLLIEVVIAIFLVALAAVPLLRPSIAMLRQEQRAVAALKLEKKLRNAHVQIIEELYRNNTSWEQLKGGGWLEFSDPGIRYKFEKEKKKGQGPTNYLVILTIEIKEGKRRLEREFVHFLQVYEEGILS